MDYLGAPKEFDHQLIVCCNMTPVVRQHHRLGVPSGGWYQEIFNSDSQYYGGSNVGNHPGVMAEPISAHSRPFSLNLTLPPSAVTMFKKR